MDARISGRTEFTALEDKRSRTRESSKGQGSIRLPTDHCHFARAIIKGNIILFRLFSSSTVPRIAPSDTTRLVNDRLEKDKPPFLLTRTELFQEI